MLHPAIMQQKRAIRIISNASYNSHTEPKFRQSEILKLHDLYEFESLIFVHDYIWPTNYPHLSREHCQWIGICLTHEKRDIYNLLYVPPYYLRFAQKLPGHILPSIWNDWSKLIPNNVSRGQTKRLINMKEMAPLSWYCVMWPGVWNATLTEIKCCNLSLASLKCCSLLRLLYVCLVSFFPLYDNEAYLLRFGPEPTPSDRLSPWTRAIHSILFIGTCTVSEGSGGRQLS